MQEVFKNGKNILITKYFNGREKKLSTITHKTSMLGTQKAGHKQKGIAISPKPEQQNGRYKPRMCLTTEPPCAYTEITPVQTP